MAKANAKIDTTCTYKTCMCGDLARGRLREGSASAEEATPPGSRRTLQVVDRCTLRR